MTYCSGLDIDRPQPMQWHKVGQHNDDLHQPVSNLWYSARVWGDNLTSYHDLLDLDLLLTELVQEMDILKS